MSVSVQSEGGQAPTNGSQPSEGLQAPFVPRPRICWGLVGTPGRTRIPNLLIRRSPSRVQGCPQPSTHAGTSVFRFHRRPQPSVGIHREWLPTWLPRMADELMARRRGGGRLRFERSPKRGSAPPDTPGVEYHEGSRRGVGRNRLGRRRSVRAGGPPDSRERAGVFVIRR